MGDLKHNLKIDQSLAPATRTASANGASVDLAGYGSAVVVAEFGLWTDGSHLPSVEESDDDSSFSAVAASDLQGSFTACTSLATDNGAQKVGYLGSKRYIRGVLTCSGTTSGAASSIIIVRSHAAQAPVA